MHAAQCFFACNMKTWEWPGIKIIISYISDIIYVNNTTQNLISLWYRSFELVCIPDLSSVRATTWTVKLPSPADVLAEA